MKDIDLMSQTKEHFTGFDTSTMSVEDLYTRRGILLSEREKCAIIMKRLGYSLEVANLYTWIGMGIMKIDTRLQELGEVL